MADERAAEFIHELSELDRGDLARLKRNAGETIASSRGVTGVFYRILPTGLAGGIQEEIYFLVASLFGLNAKPAPNGDFGATMARVKAESGAKSLDQRMAMLLDSEFDLVDGRRPGGGELAYRLRQLVKLAASKEVGVNWPRLLDDLTYWHHPNRRARKRWAQSYFVGSAGTTGPVETTAKEV